jgi:hypothetical protein
MARGERQDMGAPQDIGQKHRFVRGMRGLRCTRAELRRGQAGQFNQEAQV